MFRVGQKVECVDDSRTNLGGIPHGLKKGQIHIVAAVGLINMLDPKRLPCIAINGRSGQFWQHRFRPIVERKTNIEFAHKILRKATKQQPVGVG